MTIVAQLYFDSVASIDDKDQVAALIGGELRGAASSSPLDSDPRTYLVFLQVFSNSFAGDSISFRLYHDASGSEVDSYLKVAFEANAIIGRNSDPLLLSPNPIEEPEVEVATVDAENFFSPNGDGINDFWVVNNISELQDFQLVIYNTYGEKVFEADNYRNNWRGVYEGSVLPVDVYFYVFTHPEKPQQFSGIISLVR